MKNIVLFGGGNHVNYAIDIIEKEGKYQIVGIIDSIRDIGFKIFDYTVIGRIENLIHLIKVYEIDAGLITIGDNYSRFIVYNLIISIKHDFRFVNAIHPSAITGRNVILGFGILAMAGTIFNPGSQLGNFTFFATGSQIEHDCKILDFASVSAGTVLGGFVNLGRFSAITLGVVVLDRINIGENTIVGSGSLVLNHLPDNVLVYGSPAKIIRNRYLGEKYLK
jgi:sugar O-acyltransferase (sialic acid O-acetyltransferase NeuD family)